MGKTPTLYECAGAFLCPIAALYGRVLSEAPGDMPVTVTIGDSYAVTMPLANLQALDKAHREAFYRREMQERRKQRGVMA